VKDPSLQLMLIVFLGALGTGYFVYGKKQAKASAMIAGIGLCAFPYFVPGLYAQLAVGVILLAVPFLFRD
jgi:hypothetical protein